MEIKDDFGNYYTIKLPKRATRLCVAVFTLLLLIVLITSPLWLTYSGQRLYIQHDIAPADAVVVLGGGGMERLVHAINIYKNGYARELWITGAVEPQRLTSYTGGFLGKRLAVENGIPEDAIRLLHSRSTWEDGKNILHAAYETGADTVIVVTSWYHSRRAWRVMQKKMKNTELTYYVNSPDETGSGPDNWWKSEGTLVLVFNEYIKSLYYFFTKGVRL